MEAIQLAQMILLPSIMLSGYIFPLSSLPGPAARLAQVLPATHFIAISRGIVLRGAAFWDLWPHVAALLVIAAVLVAGEHAGVQEDGGVAVTLRAQGQFSSTRGDMIRTSGAPDLGVLPLSLFTHLPSPAPRHPASATRGGRGAGCRSRWRRGLRLP